MSPKAVISEGTLMPLSVAAVLVTLSFWSATTYQKVEANEAAIIDERHERQSTDEDLARLLRETQTGFARLEGKVDVLLKEARQR